MKVYILRGTTGEYSDYYDWIAAVYESRETAEKLRDAYNLICEGLNEYDKPWTIPSSEYPEPKFEIDYTGTKYEIEETELIEETK